MKKIAVLMVVLLPVIVASAQNNNLLSPDSALAFLKNNYPQEKVFLQTDKSWYFPGETIWMKAWCTIDGTPTYLSRIVYIELVNDQGAVIRKKMYRLDSMSSTPADIDLPEGIQSGNYSINAYTLWMLNFPAFFYQRSIYVYNVGDYKKTTASTAPPVRMLFFPEGGDLIAGTKNRVAFKAVKKGLPAEVTGTITDNTGKTVTSFKTEHDGMGTLEIEPETGKTYTANITTATNNNFTLPLPATKEEGIGLRVENTNPNRLFVLLSRAEKNKEKYSQLRIVAQMYQQIVFSANLNVDEGQLAAPIPKKKLPPGIMQITVFDAQNHPLAERLAFIENYNLVTPAVNVDTLNTKAKGKNQFSFSLNNVTIPALSCLVSSETGDMAPGQENNIASSFLLTNDINGYIHHPGYYFKNKDTQTLHHLDLLLMTQGWRRFEWKNILHNDYTPLQYPVESAISFGGTVTKSDSKELVKEGKVSFIIKGEDSTSILAEASLTDKGEFLLNDVNYMKSASVAYMGTNNKKANYIVDVKLRPTYIDSLKRSFRISVINLDTANLFKNIGNWVQDTTPFRNAKMLEGVVVKGRKITREDSLNKEYAEGPFLMGKSIDPSSVKFARSIWQVIQQTVPGVTVEGNPFDPHVAFNRFGGLGSGDVTVSGAGSSDGSLSPEIVIQTGGIAYYLNEVNVSKDVINTISVDDVALIKVLKNEGAALGASEGVIAIYTKRGVAIGRTAYEKAYAVEKKEGYAIVKQFYSPDYANEPDTKQTDKRITLYWNGRIVPASDGKYRFRFFNNDTGKKFRLIIQGIDKDGQLIYGEQVIQ